MQVSGTAVGFVPRKVSMAVVSSLHKYFSSPDFRVPAVYVYGASGSGKSRLGLYAAEKYGELMQSGSRSTSNRPAKSKAIVGYLYMNMRSVDALVSEIEDHKVPDDRKRQDKAIAEKLLVEHLVARNLGSDAVPEYAQKKLSDVLVEWGKALRTTETEHVPVHLIVHLDEVQERPWASAIMTLAIRSTNDVVTQHKAGVRVIPVVTGLSTALTDTYNKSISPMQSTTHFLKYLDPETEHAEMRAIVTNAMMAASGSKSDVPLPFDAIPELQHLVDGVSGWTLGLVRLGEAMEWQGQYGEPTEWNYVQIEEFALRKVIRTYNKIEHQLSAALGLGAGGWPKLILLACAPFRVSLVW